MIFVYCSTPSKTLWRTELQNIAELHRCYQYEVAEEKYFAKWMRTEKSKLEVYL